MTNQITAYINRYAHEYIIVSVCRFYYITTTHYYFVYCAVLYSIVQQNHGSDDLYKFMVFLLLNCVAAICYRQSVYISPLPIIGIFLYWTFSQMHLGYLSLPVQSRFYQMLLWVLAYMRFSSRVFNMIWLVQYQLDTSTKTEHHADQQHV